MARVQGKQYTLTATAAALSAAAILNTESGARFSQLDIKNPSTAANSIYIGGSNVTNVPANAYVEIAPGESWSVIAPNASIRVDDLYIVGTVNAANIAFIAAVRL